VKTLTIAGQMHAPDGSGFYRYHVPWYALNDESRHMYAISSQADGVPTAEQVAGIDVLSLQRPAGKGGARLLEQLAGHVKLIYETDDDMLQADPSGLPHLYDERMKESIRRCMRLADMVSVSTDYLAEQVAPYNDNVRVLPNYIQAKLISEAEMWRSQLSADRPLLIGWQGGTTHLIDMVTVAEPLREVLEAHPDVHVHFAGFDYSPLIGRGNGLPGTIDPDRCHWSNWQPNVWEHYRATSHFDIAIAPLADVPFNRSKSHLKALEAAAMGQPIIAADLLPYRGFVVDGVTGYLVSSKEEWKARLTELVNDADARAEMGAKARDVARQWTIQDGWKVFEAAFEEVAG
jgi:glycosyltransferase involved in cell wall biosynthesis